MKQQEIFTIERISNGKKKKSKKKKNERRKKNKGIIGRRKEDLIFG